MHSHRPQPCARAMAQGILSSFSLDPLCARSVVLVFSLQYTYLWIPSVPVPCQCVRSVEPPRSPSPGLPLHQHRSATGGRCFWYHRLRIRDEDACISKHASSESTCKIFMKQYSRVYDNMETYYCGQTPRRCPPTEVSTGQRQSGKASKASKGCLPASTPRTCFYSSSPSLFSLRSLVADFVLFVGIMQQGGTSPETTAMRNVLTLLPQSTRLVATTIGYESPSPFARRRKSQIPKLVRAEATSVHPL